MSAEQELRERNQALIDSFGDGLIEHGTVGEEEIVQSAEVSGVTYFGNGTSTTFNDNDTSIYTTSSISGSLMTDGGTTSMHIATIVQTKKTAYCWNPDCDKENMVHREKSNVDGRYGHLCPCCNKSLREHPMYGEGKEYDLGDSKKRRNWNILTPYEKRMEKKRYKRFKEAV